MCFLNYLSAIKRSEFESVVMGMNLESVVQSGVSQKEKNKCTNMESRKMVLLNLFLGQE